MPANTQQSTRASTGSVRLRRSLAADLSSELADLLLVDAADDDLVLGRNVDGDAVDLIDNNI